MKQANICRTLLLLLVLQLVHTTVPAQLRKIYSDTQTPNNYISSLGFYSPKEGYAAFNGYVGYTSDSGHTFIKKFIGSGNVDLNGNTVDAGTTFRLDGLKSFSHDTVLVYGAWGNQGAILYSTDACATYKMVYRSPSLTNTSDFQQMIFPENHVVGYAAEGFGIVKTTDGGRTWTRIYNPSQNSANYVRAIESPSATCIYAAAGYLANPLNLMVKSTDGGSTWQTVALPAGQILEHLSFITNSKGWICTQENDPTTSWGNIYYTSNGGSSWTQKDCTPFFYETPETIKFINDSTGYRLTGFFQLYKSTDSGKVWERLPRDNNFYVQGGTIYDLQVLDQNQLWTGGAGGFLEISTNAGGTPFPTSDFTTDTVGFYRTGTVNLYTCSNRTYQYTWLVNSTVISHDYNTSYQHNPSSLHDTITLIVFNGTYSDTSKDYLNFNPPAICAGGSANFTSNITGAGYQWQQNSGSGFVNLSNGANVNGATAATLTLTQVPAAWSGYRYRCLVGTQISMEFLLTVNAAPVANAGADKSICSGGAGVQIGTAAIANQTYSWSPAAGLSSAAVAQPVANPAATTVYSLTVSTGPACSATSSVTVNVSTTPATPVITPAGSQHVCTGGTVVLQSSSATGNQWYRDGNAISGATGQSYTAAQAGAYTVKATAGSCTSAASAAVSLTVTATPATPVVTQLGNVLISSASAGNQWYKDGVAISGANSPLYSPAQNGSYTVVATVNGCASAASNAFSFVITAINSPALDKRITVGPNPVSGQLQIGYSGTAANFEVSVEDMAGRKMLAPRGFSGNYALDMRGLGSGLYIVRIRNKRSGEHVQRLIMKL